MAASSTSTCLITADPDIAGIGVRVAFYLQALLPLVSTVSILPSSITFEDAALVWKHYKRSNASLVALSATTASLLIVAFIKHGSQTLSPYHAIVVLNLTWIVLISSCCRAAIMYQMQGRGILWSYPHQLDEDDQRRRLRVGAGVQGLRALLIKTSQGGREFMASNHIPLLCLHLFTAGILGWLLFTDIGGFSGGKECPDDTVLWMGRSFVHLTAPALRRFWKAVYMAAILSPFTVPSSVYLACFLSYPISILLLGLERAVLTGALLLYRRMFPTWIVPQTFAMGEDKRCRLSWSDLALILVELLSGALLVLLIISTEKTVTENPVGANDEGYWGFGQILALVLSTAPLYEAGRNLWMCWKLRTASRRVTSILQMSKPLLARMLTFGDRAFECSSSGDGGDGRGGRMRSQLIVRTVPVPESNAVIIDLTDVVPEGGDQIEHTGSFDIDRITRLLSQAVKRLHERGDGVQVGVQLTQLLRNPDSRHHSDQPGCTRSTSHAPLLEPGTLDHALSGEDRSPDQALDSGTKETYYDHKEFYPEKFKEVEDAYTNAARLCIGIGIDFIEVPTIHGCLPELSRLRPSPSSADPLGTEVNNPLQMTQKILKAVRGLWPNRVLAIVVCCEQKDWDMEDTITLSNLVSVAAVDLVTASSDGCTPFTIPVSHVSSALARMTGEHGRPLMGMSADLPQELVP